MNSSRSAGGAPPPRSGRNPSRCRCLSAGRRPRVGSSRSRRRSTRRRCPGRTGVARSRTALRGFCWAASPGRGVVAVPPARPPWRSCQSPWRPGAPHPSHRNGCGAPIPRSPPAGPQRGRSRPALVAVPPGDGARQSVSWDRLCAMDHRVVSRTRGVNEVCCFGNAPEKWVPDQPLAGPAPTSWFVGRINRSPGILLPMVRHGLVGFPKAVGAGGGGVGEFVFACLARSVCLVNAFGDLDLRRAALRHIEGCDGAG